MLRDANLMQLEPYDIPGVRELAKMCNISLSHEASSEEIQQKLFPVWGTEKAFFENAPKVAEALKLDDQVIPSQEALDALKSTETLDRWSLRNIYDGELPPGSVITISRGAVANWMERGVREDEYNRQYYDLQIAGRFLIASDRLCDKDSEMENFFVKQFQAEKARFPTEAELLPDIVEHVTGQKRAVKVVAPNQADQIRQLAKDQPTILSGRIYIATNANATYVALQIRRVLQELFGGFDAGDCQFWFSQDGFPLATTSQQAADPGHYQRPLTVFSGLVRLLNELCLLQGR